MNEIEFNPNVLVKSTQLAALSVDRDRYTKYFLTYDKFYYLSNYLKTRLQGTNEKLFEGILENPKCADSIDSLNLVSSHIGGQIEENLFGWYD